ncbi:unnamed protein product [Lymnaea stagnalis]|uniref:EGF-like domain-containing protein n=1 Tax=Lymnaea stagnalis TaxID=6523 RepID=A0AAV2IEH4_LYMST
MMRHLLLVGAAILIFVSDAQVYGEDPCQIVRCSYGANCIAYGDTAICECPFGYSGIRCQDPS